MHYNTYLLNKIFIDLLKSITWSTLFYEFKIVCTHIHQLCSLKLKTDWVTAALCLKTHFIDFSKKYWHSYFKFGYPSLAVQLKSIYFNTYNITVMLSILVEISDTYFTYKNGNTVDRFIPLGISHTYHMYRGENETF